MREHPLLFFFLIAYAFSWIMSLPFVLSEWGILPGDFTVAFALKSFGPFLAAYILIRIVEGKEGLLRFRQRFRPARAGWKWYLLILLVVPAPILLGIITQPGALANFPGLSPAFLVTCLVTFILVLLGGGPLGEEPGWRGFALPHLQARYGPLWGTLLLSVLWTFWHLPDFLTSQQGGGPGTGLTPFLYNLPFFLLLVTALAIIFTWVFNHTEGSIFAAILMHACVNVSQVILVPLFPTLDFTHMDIAAFIGYGVPALLIVILTRGRLGYLPNQEQPVRPEEFETRPVH
ncbi:MAG TPA: CPBP family intramembrane glutamic endopeptidase [Anaerolineales bacterium]|nr:CPBP family intramembrane glutamic endopeptidase [Anaerolineales bacterium]